MVSDHVAQKFIWANTKRTFGSIEAQSVPSQYDRPQTEWPIVIEIN